MAKTAETVIRLDSESSDCILVDDSETEAQKARLQGRLDKNKQIEQKRRLRKRKSGDSSGNKIDVDENTKDQNKSTSDENTKDQNISNQTKRSKIVGSKKSVAKSTRERTDKKADTNLDKVIDQVARGNFSRRKSTSDSVENKEQSASQTATSSSIPKTVFLKIVAPGHNSPKYIRIPDGVSPIVYKQLVISNWSSIRPQFEKAVAKQEASKAVSVASTSKPPSGDSKGSTSKPCTIQCLINTNQAPATSLNSLVSSPQSLVASPQSILVAPIIPVVGSAAIQPQQEVPVPVENFNQTIVQQFLPTTKTPPEKIRDDLAKSLDKELQRCLDGKDVKWSKEKDTFTADVMKRSQEVNLIFNHYIKNEMELLGPNLRALYVEAQQPYSLVCKIQKRIDRMLTNITLSKNMVETVGKALQDRERYICSSFQSSGLQKFSQEIDNLYNFSKMIE